MSDHNQNGVQVEFKKFGLTVQWNKNFESPLELAEDAGVFAYSSCQSGTCQTCLVQVIEGTFIYGDNDVFIPESDDGVLICFAVPTSNMVIKI